MHESAYVSGYHPEWHLIKDGILKGRSIYIDPKDGYWQSEMIEGNYDQFLYDYLSHVDLDGKVVVDIGAHIGYHSMQFAQLVGGAGKVYVFEPNLFNVERLKLHMSKNPDLSERINLYDIAVSDNVGEIEFNFSSEVDGGESSGSFIKSAHPPLQADVYQKIGFKAVKVKTVTLDRFLSALDVVPYLIKIDVEGGEHLVLGGANEVLKKHRPILLVEMHSIYCMLNVSKILNSLNYEIDLLKEDEGGRCFIAAKFFGGTSAELEAEKYYLQRYEQVQKICHLLQQEKYIFQKELRQLQQSHQALVQEHQALVREHQTLVREHQTLLQSKAVQFAIELGRHPALLKAGNLSYGVLARIFKSFRGK